MENNNNASTGVKVRTRFFGRDQIPFLRKLIGKNIPFKPEVLELFINKYILIFTYIQSYNM